MNPIQYIDNSIDRKLLDMNIVYLAEILSIDGKTAKIQPLGLIKQEGEKPIARAIVSDVPMSLTAFQNAKVGNIAICVCADRDITDAKQGKNNVPISGHHSISDSILIDVLA